MNPKETVLVVVAHPDDELLGVGGTLLRHRKFGDAIHILILSDGEASRREEDLKELSERKNASFAVAEALSAHLQSESFEDQQFDSVPILRIIQVIEDVVASVQPTIIYTHHLHDLNKDHSITAEAVLTACRPLPGKTVRDIFAFETLSSTEWQLKDHRQFAPNYYVDISEHLVEKNQLLRHYQKEMRLYPHPRSYEGVEILARYRGMEVGMEAAEAFQAIRMLRRN